MSPASEVGSSVCVTHGTGNVLKASIYRAATSFDAFFFR